jgi:CelD/BcsL family acetyltransferase involved in cellulose biosynthesis
VRWQRFVDAHPQALPFHGAAWGETLAACYGFRPLVVVVTGPSGAVEAGIPVMDVADRFKGRRWIALPFTDRCPPLLASPETEAPLAAALTAAVHGAGLSRAEVRWPVAGFAQRAVATSHTLDLSPGADELPHRFTPAVRRNVRRAQREQVTLRHAESEAELTGTFYRLHLDTRRRLGVPVQPRHFFSLLWRLVIEPGAGHVLLASYNGAPIAGAVFLHGTRTVVYKYGASDPRSWHLRPNNLIFAEAIRSSAEQGFASFDFGRSDFADEGLRAFKRSWGSVEEPLVYSRLDEADSGTQHGLAERLLGDAIKRSPKWVCRAIGEKLYRYAA